MSIKLDLSQFKHVKSDGKTTTLQHRDGHQLTIAHKSMSPEAQKQLTALATSAQTPLDKQESTAMMASGGLSTATNSIQNYATYGQNTNPEPQTPDQKASRLPPTNDQQKAAVKAQLDKVDQENATDQARMANGMAEGGKVSAAQTIKNKRMNPDSKSVIVLPSAQEESEKKQKDTGFGKVQMKADGGTLQAASNNQSATNSTGVASASDIWNNVKGAFDSKANGGEIKKPKFCAYCGGMAHGGECKSEPKMYADPQEPVSQDDSAPTAPQALQPAPDVAQATSFDLPKAEQDNKQKLVETPPIMQATRDKYNQLAGNNPGDPTAPIVDPGIMTFGPNGEPPKNFNPDIWSQAEQQIKTQSQMDLNAKTQEAQKIQAENEVRARAGLDPVPLPQAVPKDATQDFQQQIGAIPQNSNQPNTPAPTVPGAQPASAPSESYDPEQMLKSGYSQELAGIHNTGVAQAQQAEAQQADYQKQIDIQQHAQQNYQNSVATLDKERQNFISDIQNNHISPEQYWTGTKNPQTGEYEGGHSKIAAGIGMLLAGFNPTNNPNAAIQFLQKQMDRNMDAQVQNMGARKTLLEANLHQFQNLNQATSMTRIMMNDALSNQINMEASKAASPLAKAAAQNAIGQLQMDSSQKFRQLSLMHAMTQLATNSGGNPDAIGQTIGYMRAINPEMAKTYEQLYVPGIGLGKVPVPDNARQELTAKQDLNNAAQDLYQYSKQHTNLVPGSADYNFGVTKALAFQQKVREGLLGTVFRESEKPLLEKFSKENPAGAFKALSTQPQLRAIIDSNNNSLNVLKKTYGLPTPAPGPQIKTVNGVQYIRGPNGQAVPYKGK